tara:strand:+ start:1814 stop:2110 length:297 start_codon:yes stop_codon:yes gene_type:complete
MSINYTYNVRAVTEKLGGNGEILQVHVDLIGIDEKENKAVRQFATSLASLPHTDSNFIANPTNEQKLTWAKNQWGVEGENVPSLVKFEESIKEELGEN